ncbi:type 2 lanthipeptide synthetase LanM family protein [Parasphingorhabdus sp.]|uniref:type 2 lanthipeptide synthetase LanM family protein n=1 Tax=Parasphingorhabdus sp. TaxID=2709688 RepID=UPI003263530E
MSEYANYRIFDKQLGRLAAPFEERLAARLQELTDLADSEKRAIMSSAKEAFLFRLSRRLSRVLILELNAARVEGRLDGETSRARWQDFCDTAATQAFWDYCFKEYPDLYSRLEKLLDQQCSAIAAIAVSWCADRTQISAMMKCDTVVLTALSLGQGDTHNGGQTVSIIDTDGGKIVYKPRSLAIDTGLTGFLQWLNAQTDEPLHIKVPDVLDKGSYGWAQFVSHEYAADDAECQKFYCGIGQILALMRLLGGTDLHAENLIAHRDMPVLVDCETLFTPNVKPVPSGYGDAYDYCSELTRGGVLAIGLLPDRGQALGWRGIDMSGVGGLSGQQPKTSIPAIVDAGRDTARVEMVTAELPRSANHPSKDPAITRYWPDIVDHFKKLSTILRSLDQAGKLEPQLDGFRDRQIRVVVRPTETYAEIERMLWHPASLANPEAARQKAESLMAEMAENISYAPSDPMIISAEVTELRHGDIPVFTTQSDYGALTGPNDIEWLAKQDLIALALEDWRDADLDAEANFIRAAVVSAYVSDGHMHDGESLWIPSDKGNYLDACRREHAARIMTQIVATGHKADDGSIAWIAPTLTPAGWSVSPLGADLYAGLSGVALLAASYLSEMRSGRADPVEGLEDVMVRLEKSLAHIEERQLQEMDGGKHVRPPAIGGFAGVASQIWALLAMADIDDQPAADKIERALRLVPLIKWGAETEETNDLLYGLSGAIYPLVRLAEVSGEERPLAVARDLADSLAARSIAIGDAISWPVPYTAQGLGGFSHGTTGIGWAMQKLHEATGDPVYQDFAMRAFQFEDGLYDPERRNWRDLREIDGVTESVAWCHGAVGIGLAHLDMDPTLHTEHSRAAVQIAIDAVFDRGLGWNHCICHGDFGAWDLIGNPTVQRTLNVPMSAEAFGASLLASLDVHGPTCGVTRDAFLPGLFTGHGGVAYQLLRMNPDSKLPSALMLGRSE